MNIDDKTMQALAASLKYRQLRQELIASNIANAETPGYKAKKIDFEKTNSIIEKQFNINNNQSSDILDEWLREQKIISYLKLDIEKNKDYLVN